MVEGHNRGVLHRLKAAIRAGVTSAVVRPFTHTTYPLSNTLDFQGDPGLLGPDSVSWRVIGDIAALVGGLRSLLIQAALPEVVAGVGDHSRYREDPLGRLSRTSAYIAAVTYGAMPEVDQAVEQVHRIHRSVSGTSSRGVPYAASDPSLAAWVHNALTDSLLTANQMFGAHRLDEADADRFVFEQRVIGTLFGAEPMPDTAAELADWIDGHPWIAPSPQMEEAVAFLTNPPLDLPTRAGYRLLIWGAIATIPGRVRSVLGLEPKPGALAVTTAAVRALRSAMGNSPSWRLALQRVGAPIPDGLFIQHPWARTA